MWKWLDAPSHWLSLCIMLCNVTDSLCRHLIHVF